jgi:hypothetical protein
VTGPVIGLVTSVMPSRMGAQGVRLIEGLVASVAEAREGQGGAGAGGALPFLHRVGAQLAAELQVRWMGPGSARTLFINESR